MPSKPERSPAGRFRSGSHPARRIPADLHTAAGPQPVEAQPAIAGQKAPQRPRLGNPPAAVVARGNLPKPGRRKAILRPSVPVPGGNDRRPRTGLLALKAKVMLRGLAVVNRRTKAARDVVKWRAELVAELGGEPGMTAARLTRIETLVRTKLLLEHLDAQLLEYDTLFSRKRGTLRPQVKAILTERNRMAEALERGLAALGSSRSKGTVLPSLDDLVGGDQQ
jgi:hypothetical protein